MAQDKQHTNQEYKVTSVPNSGQVKVARQFKLLNATVLATKTVSIELPADRPITTMTVENHFLVVRYSTGAPSVYFTDISDFEGEQLSVEYAAGQSQSLTYSSPFSYGSDNLTISAKGGKVTAKIGPQEKVVSQKNSDVVGIFQAPYLYPISTDYRVINYVGTRIIVIYSDGSHNFLFPNKLINELTKQREKKLELVGQQFLSSIMSISENETTADGHNVRKVMREIHARIMECVKLNNSSTQIIAESMSAFENLTAMIWDKEKCKNPIVFNSKKKPVTNVILGTLCLIGAAALLGSSIALIIFILPLLVLSTLTFAGAGFLGYLAVDRLHQARKDYTLSKNIFRFKAYAQGLEVGQLESTQGINIQL